MAPKPESPVVPEYVHKATEQKLQAEAAFLAAQARNEVAQAKRAEVEAAIAQHVKKREDYAEQVRLAQNVFHGLIYFVSEVGPKSVESCIDRLDLHERVHGTSMPVEMVFTSPGGDVVTGMRLFDHITGMRDRGFTINIGTRGIAASMAGVLLQAGSHRWMGRESYVLIHQISAGVAGSFGDIEDRVKWFEKLQNRILDVFAARAAEAGKNGTASQPATRRYLAKQWERTDWWLDSDECLRLGIVDEVR